MGWAKTGCPSPRLKVFHPDYWTIERTLLPTDNKKWFLWNLVVGRLFDRRLISESSGAQITMFVVTNKRSTENTW